MKVTEEMIFELEVLLWQFMSSGDADTWLDDPNPKLPMVSSSLIWMSPIEYIEAEGVPALEEVKEMVSSYIKSRKSAAA